MKFYFLFISDTKRIALFDKTLSTIEGAGADLDTQLERLYETVTRMPGAPKIVNRGPPGGGQAAHDAGYDAMLTASAFIGKSVVCCWLAVGFFFEVLLTF